MKPITAIAILFTFIVQIFFTAGQEISTNKTAPIIQLENYFRSQVLRIASDCLNNINTMEAWLKQREVYKKQILEMLGLDPLPERTPLNAVITGKIEHEDFTVEKLHFQSMPRLYVTANLYIPKKTTLPAPAVLYLCGHAYPLKPNFYHGNKVNYQHHAIWFARNGYVCLVIDTLQLGEIPGQHHGTYRLDMWWWNSRGYTPAGIEAWNATRAIDYLFTRSEVDTNKIAVTGRSGGGSYSWTVMAIDERIKVGAPVAGITDLYNYVVDGTVEGHCDCMFFVNTFKWDYPMLAALAAPRPLLICNTDSDTIFPLDGVVRTHAKVRKIYQLFNAQTNLGLVIVPGPHKDVQELQIPVFRWFNKFLKGIDRPVDQIVTNLYQPEELKVFADVPQDQINTNIHSIFIPIAKEPRIPDTYDEWRKFKSNLINQLKEKVFQGWNDAVKPTPPIRAFSVATNGAVFESWIFASEPVIKLNFYVLRPEKLKQAREVEIILLNTNHWSRFSAWATAAFGNIPSIVSAGKSEHSVNILKEIEDLVVKRKALVFFAPRGIGADDWLLPSRKYTQVLRRFMLIGQTLEGMRVWDIKRVVETLSYIERFRNAKISLSAEGSMAVNAIYATLFVPRVAELNVSSLPASHLSIQPMAPDYLNILKIMDIPVAVALCTENTIIHAGNATKESGNSPCIYAGKVAQKFGWQKNLDFQIEVSPANTRSSILGW